MQIRALLRSAIQNLTGYTETPTLDAELLLSYVLGIDRTQVFVQLDNDLSHNEVQVFMQLVDRRKTGEPIAYLLGYREFWSLPLEVTSDTLIPRPETELLVELALQKLPKEAECRIADLGTGSGAIALALASERPQWLIIATDCMVPALLIAKRNAKRLGITNIDFRQGDWCKALENQQFDAIMSNPPYISENDKHLLEGGLRFEPKTALVADKNGLHALQTIIEQASKHLVSGGWLLLEHSYDQADKVRELLLVDNYKQVDSYCDLAGIARVTIGQK